MTRIHSADIARRAGKQASEIDDRLQRIKRYEPELWAELDAQEAERKSNRGSSSQKKAPMFYSIILDCRDKSQNLWPTFY